MRIRPARLVSLLALPLAVAALSVPASAEPPDPGTVDASPGLGPVVTDEQDCTEAGFVRGGKPAEVRALVPARYGLAINALGAALLTVNEVTCQEVGRDGHPWVAGPTTTMILSANLTSIDGVPVTGSRYLLSYATTNRPLSIAYRRLGLPAELLGPDTGFAAESRPNGATQATWTASGGGWDHTSTMVAVEPTAAPTASTARYYVDGAQGNLVLTYDNRFSQSAGQLTADLSATPFGPLSFLSPVLTNVQGAYIRGGWVATLSATE
jgi:hypothetical protein